MTDVAGQWMRLHPFSKEKTWVGAEFVQQLEAEIGDGGCGGSRPPQWPLAA